MAQNNLPEIWDTMRGLLSSDNGNVFSRNFFFPKSNEKRIDAQKEVLMRMVDYNESIKLAEIKMLSDQMKFSYESQKLKYETFCQVLQILQESGIDNLNGIEDNDTSIIRTLGDIISRL